MHLNNWVSARQIIFLLFLVSFSVSALGITVPALSADTVAQTALLDVSTCSDLAAVVASPVSSGKTILVTAEIKCDSLTVPADRALRIVKGGSVNNSGKLIINGPFEAGRYRVFTGSGPISLSLASISEFLPEWVGAVADASVDGTAGTDSTAALQKAFDVPHPVRMGTGNYLFSNLTIPPNKVIRGYGIHATNLIAKTGSAGVALTDRGNAAKITLEDFAIYANRNSYSAVIRLGYNGLQFGTEGFLNNLWVRDAHSAIGFDINGNVGHFGRIMAQETQGIKIIGSGNMVGMVESYGSSGFGVPGNNGRFGTYLQDTHVDALEIEAPAASTIPLYLAGNTQIDSLWFSFRNPLKDGGYVPLVFSHLVEIDASATTWGINNLKLYLGHSKENQSIITNGNFKSGSRYFGGNASWGNHDGEGNYASSMYLSGESLAIKQQQLQSFTLRIANNNGVMQHRFGSSGNGSTNTNFVSRVKGAIPKFSTTPVDPDEFTPFVGGGKISFKEKNIFILDTAIQNVNDSILFASIVFNNTGTGYSVIPLVYNSDVNGDKHYRIAFALKNAATGTDVPINETAIPSGKHLDISFIGFIN